MHKRIRPFQKVTVVVLAVLMALTMGSTSLAFADEAPAGPTLPEKLTMTGRPSNATKQADVSLALTGATEDWASKVTEVTVDGVAVPKREAKTGEPVFDSTQTCDINEFGIVQMGTGKIASFTLAIPTECFAKTPKRSNTYKIVVKAEGYKDTEADVTIESFGADKLYVRHLDKDGKVLSTKTYTMEDIEGLAAYQKNVEQQGLCSHHGIRGFMANGITIEDLFKDAGIDSYWKEGAEIRLRVNDADDATVNDDPDKDNYMAEGAYSYSYLMGQPRYIFTDINKDAGNTELYNKIMELQSGSTKVIWKDAEGNDIEKSFHNYLNEDMRAALATAKKQEVKPFIATEMYENDLDYGFSPIPEYGTTRANYGFRFFYGMAMDETGIVAKDETNQRLAYYVYGIDLQDTDEHSIDRSALDAEVQKAWKLAESDYTPESWAAFKTAFDNAKVLVYVEGLNQNVAQHWKTDQAYLNQRLSELIAAEEGLVKVKQDEPAPVKPTLKAATIKVSPLTKTFKAKALKKAKKTFALKAKVNSKAKASFKKTSGNKKITVSKAGKVTVKKGLKKGSYKIKVKVTAPATKAYKAVTKTFTITVKVK